MGKMGIAIFSFLSWISSANGLSLFDCSGIYRFSEGLGSVVVNGKIGYIDARGKIKIPPQFDHGGYFFDGLAPVTIKGKVGFINREGKMIIKPQFEAAGEFSEGIAWVITLPNRDEGLIDQSGKVFLKFSSRNYRWGFSEGLAKVEVFTPQDNKRLRKLWKMEKKTDREEEEFSTLLSKRKFGFADKTGRLVIEGKYDDADKFSEGLAAVKIGKKWGYIDKTGKTVLPFKFINTDGFSEGLAWAVLDNEKRAGYIDKIGKWVISPRDGGVDNFSDGLAMIYVKGKHGYIDKKGNCVIAPQFTEAKRFSEGLAAVGIGKYAEIRSEPESKPSTQPGTGAIEGSFVIGRYFDGQWGYIDKCGRMVIKPKFAGAGEFHDGRASVIDGDGKGSPGMKFGYIDKKGNYIWKPTQ